MRRNCFRWLAAMLAGLVVSCKPVVLTRQEVVARMTNTYAHCRSYQDTGESVMIIQSSRLPGAPPMALTNLQPFSLKFRRPASVRFEFAHQEDPENVTADMIRNRANWPRSNCLLWGSGDVLRIYSERTHRYWQGAGLLNAIAAVTPLARGGRRVLDLLTAARPSGILFELQSMTAMREDQLDGTTCYVLSGNEANHPMVTELWIGKKDFLLRKLKTTIEDPRTVSIFEENHRDVRINRRIFGSVFKFQLPDDAQLTTNALSLLPDVERMHNAMRKVMDGAPSVAGTNFPSWSPKARKVIPLAGIWQDAKTDYYKSPTYLDCFPDKVVIYSGNTAVTAVDLSVPGSAVEKLMDKIEQHAGDERLVVLVRPGSVKLYRQVRNLVGRRRIDVGYEAVDADFTVNWNAATNHLAVAASGERPATSPPSPAQPVFRPTPTAVATSKQAIFFECRQNEAFVVDKAGLDEQVAKVLTELSPGVRGGDVQNFLKKIQSKEIGNAYYKVNPSYLLAAIMALEPRAGMHGDGLADLDRADSKFRTVLTRLDSKSQYLVFMVRDDSFPVFRRVRKLASDAGFETGWELLGTGEPIKFGAGGAASRGVMWQ